jgi:hypothetical protein
MLAAREDSRSPHFGRRFSPNALERAQVDGAQRAHRVKPTAHGPFEVDGLGQGVSQSYESPREPTEPVASASARRSV